MNRSKIIFAAVSVVFVVLVAVAGFVANGKRAAAEKAKKGRDREFSERHERDGAPDERSGP